MKKRFISLILMLAILLTVCPASILNVEAEENVDLGTIIEEQIREYCATFVTNNNTMRNGCMQLINHARNGEGEKLLMDEEDAFTTMLMNSALLQENLIHTSTVAIENLQESYDDLFYMRGSCAWYQDEWRYSNTAYVYDGNEDNADDVRVSPSVVASNKAYEGTVNECDEGLMLVVGTGHHKTKFEKVNATSDEMTYRVTFTLYDDFDFVGASYDSDDYLEKALTAVGKLLELGLIDTYSWEAVIDFELTVPNSCTHQTADYRWEYDGTDLVSAASDGIQENTLTKIQTEKSDGTLYDPYYEMEKTARLLHNLPWVVEFRMQGKSGFILAQTSNYTSGQPYILKSTIYLAGGEVFSYTETDSETGEEVKKYGRNQYTADFSKSGYKYSELHTYRLENRIEQDGSNMVYLLIDGEEIGALDDFWLYNAGVRVNSDSQVEDDWFNGQDLYINYIFNTNYKFASDLEIEYIQIWENGEGAQAHSYYESTVQEPTCTEQGMMVHTCSICHTSYETDVVEALGHKYGDWTTVTEPTYTKVGLEKRICAVCKEEETREIPMLDNPFTDVSETDYYYQPVLWAVENEITKGTSETTFSPKDTCTRGQVVTFLWRASGSPEPSSAESPFVDVKEDDYFYKAVLWAVENEITKGTSETTFSPKDTCTRGQVVTFLWRLNEEAEPTSTTNPFNDVKEEDYFYQAVLWAVENGITQGTSETTFEPKDTCIRAQVVTFLYRAQ